MWVVTRAYKVINAKILKNETRIISIDIYIESQVLKAHTNEKSKVDEIVIDTCRRIYDQLKKKQSQAGITKNTPR